MQLVGQCVQGWTELPINDLAILAVEALARQENMPAYQDINIPMEWRPGVPIDLDVYDRDFDPERHGDELDDDHHLDPQYVDDETSSVGGRKSLKRS